MTNLLAQRKEIKRLEKVAERMREEEEEQRIREDEEARQRAIEEFEAVQMGLERKIGAGSRVVGREKESEKVVVEKEDETTPGQQPKGTKRKFEIDEEELKRIAMEERSRARLAIDEEKKAARGHLPSFWVPTETPEGNHKAEKKVKQAPTCPASQPDKPHALSLKGLTSVHFTDEKSSETGKPVHTCPSCKKTLTNSTKAVLAIPCGHVLCKPCVGKFLTPDQRHHRDAHDDTPQPESVHCYVCDADLTPKPETKEKESRKDKKEKKEKEKGPSPGLVEIRTEGTGFAGGGKNIVKREGVAFQV